MNVRELRRFRSLSLGLLFALPIVASLPRAAAAWQTQQIPYRSYCAAWMRRISRAGSMARQSQGPGVPGSALGGGASIWRYELSAPTPAALSVELTMQTTKGWYRVTAPTVPLARDDGNYRSSEAAFRRYEVHSPAQFFELPSAAGRPKYVWVSEVGDAGATPQTPCPAMWVKAPRSQKHAKPKKQSAAERNLPKSLRHFRTKRVNPSVYDAHALPPVGAIARAHAISEPASVLTCTHPFRQARAERVTAPDYPGAAAAEGEYYELAVAVSVELGRKGQIVGLGFESPSGHSLFDGNALYAASQTIYSPKIGLCRPVPGFYIFDAEYAPG